MTTITNFGHVLPVYARIEWEVGDILSCVVDHTNEVDFKANLILCTSSLDNTTVSWHVSIYI